jgi:hypothetical protein
MAVGIELNAQSSTRSALSIMDQPKVRLFPNPATTSLQVEWNEPIKPASMIIVNGVTGKKMAAGTINNGPLRINVSDYAPGIYVFRMFSASGNYLGGATFQVSK